MSSMLEQAILDAKELKEAAIKNAQQSLIEKYSGEFEGEIERLLEQAADPAAATAPATDPAAAAASAITTPAAPMPGMATPGSLPVDPQKAKDDADNKSSIFDKLDYAFKDGEVIADKVYPTGVVEIDLDSLSEFGFKKNQETPEKLALQELKALSRKSKLNEELEEEMNDDEDYDEESETYPYEDSDEDDDIDHEEDEELDDEDSEDDFEDEESDFDSDSEELSDIHDFNDEGSFEDEESDLDDEDDLDVDIEDEDFEDDEDSEEDDLYGTEDDVGFHIDYDSDEDEEDSDYNPDADVEDFDDEESDEDEEDTDDEESEEDEEDEEEYYSDEEEDSEDDEEELDEGEKKTLSIDDVLSKIEKLEDSMKKQNIKDSLIQARITDIIDAVKKLKPSDREKLKEAIKLDWKRSGPRSPWNGMFREEGEHDVALAELQAQIAELEQEVDSLKESNKKLKSGLKDSIKLNEGLVQKINNYEQKLHESRILNYKLLYTNKALSDSSLNGQQKEKIAESISNAKTAEEVKLLYETLKSTMRDGSTRSTPKSLSEAVERRSSSILLRGSRAEPKKQDDIAERMKRLAGL